MQSREITIRLKLTAPRYKRLRQAMHLIRMQFKEPVKIKAALNERLQGNIPTRIRVKVTKENEYIILDDIGRN